MRFLSLTVIFRKRVNKAAINRSGPIMPVITAAAVTAHARHPMYSRWSAGSQSIRPQRVIIMFLSAAWCQITSSLKMRGLWSWMSSWRARLELE